MADSGEIEDASCRRNAAAHGPIRHIRMCLRPAGEWPAAVREAVDAGGPTADGRADPEAARNRGDAACRGGF